ncbi:MAG: DUF1345 domain-containing protein [Gloeobacterales cyanobacterium]
MKSLPVLLRSLEAHQRLLFSIGIALAAFFAQPGWIHLQTRLVVAWDLGTICFLALTWAIISTASPEQTNQSATEQDQSGAAILTLVLIADIASLGAVGLNTHGVPKVGIVVHLIVSIVAIICSWLLAHTMFTLHYAHRYYRAGLLKVTADPDEAGGLDFPGKDPPDYLDFAYFSFVIGMTSQVSDVQITSPSMRRLALIHGILSFAFNTVILALSVNILAGLV